MKECFRCGATSENEELLECIYKFGVVNVCLKCYPKLRIPIIEKKNVDWSQVDCRVPLKDRMGSSMSKTPSSIVNREKYGLRTDDEEIKKVVSQNLIDNSIKKENLSNELVDNFNWVIRRARRASRMTQSQLGERVKMPEIVIHALENGTLPMDYKDLLKKIEGILGVRLLNSSGKRVESVAIEKDDDLNVIPEPVVKKPFSFNLFRKKEDMTQSEYKDAEIELDDLTLEAVNNLVGEPVEDKPKKIEEKKFDNCDELTDEEMRKLIWGN